METQKPKAKVTGEDSNVMTTLSICTKALKRAGMPEKASELTTKVFNSGSYQEAISIMGEYCELS